MTGVTTAPEVLNALKSVFRRNGRDNFVLRLYTAFTPIVFLILAGLIFWQRMIKEHINCHTPQDDALRPSAVNQYCFATGTYTVIDCPSSPKSLYPGVCSKSQGTEGGKLKYHLYYQWVPFVLLVQAILFILPKLFWREKIGDVWAKYIKDIENIKDDNALKARRFKWNIKHQNLLVRNYYLYGCSNLAVVIMSCFISDSLLNGQFLSLGKKWILSENSLDWIFPKMSKCEFKKFGPSGGIIDYDLLCVMPLNVLQDKIFLFQWFWFWVLITLQFLRMLYDLTFLLSKLLRKREVMKKIEEAFFDDSTNSDYKKLERDSKTFITGMEYTDWFVLKTIASGMNPRKFTVFMTKLIEQNNLSEIGSNKAETNSNLSETETMLLRKLEANNTSSQPLYMDQQQNQHYTANHSATTTEPDFCNHDSFKISNSEIQVETNDGKPLEKIICNGIFSNSLSPMLNKDKENS